MNNKNSKNNNSNKTNNMSEQKKAEEAIKLAKEEKIKCVETKCRKAHPKIRYVLESEDECKKKFNDDKSFEKYTKIDKCLEEKNIQRSDIIQISKCMYNKCNEKVNNVFDAESQLLYATHPKGKELKKLEETNKQLGKDIQLCEKTHCGHIYPLDKLEKEKKKCRNSDYVKQLKCMEKKKLPEIQREIRECVDKNCEKLFKESDKNFDKIFKLRNPKLKTKKKLGGGNKKSRN
jgi:hypothetical protein